MRNLNGSFYLTTEAPWPIVVFSLGMYLVVYGLRNAGLTEMIAALLDYLASHSLWPAN